MSSPTTISSEKLSRLIGTARMPVLIDKHTNKNNTTNTRLIPGSIKRHDQAAEGWGKEYSGRKAVVACLLGQQ